MTIIRYVSLLVGIGSIALVASGCSPKIRPNYACHSDGECAPDEICRDQLCTQVECKVNQDCPAGEECVDHECRQIAVCKTDDLCSDGNICNGHETCNAETQRCEAGTPQENGFVCLVEPRSICLEGRCVKSTCGDGFMDAGLGESCEPPGVGDCDAECHLSCRSGEDCPDDGDACNGEEYCDTDNGHCSHRNPSFDGTVCGTDPRKICRSGHCQESVCGDGFTDEGNSEECDDKNNVEGDGCDTNCTYSCHEDHECEDGHDCTDDMCVFTSHACHSTPSTADTLCRASADVCDMEEYCDGVSPDCPEDALVSSGIACRPAAGDCDAEESCTGSSPTCPPDEMHPDTAVCRPASSYCDIEESCTGSSIDCPEDATNCTWHQRPITVDNTANSEILSYYQIKVVLDTAALIAEGKMRTDCGDIRFTDSDGTASLSYWIESGCNSSATLFWTKVPSIPGSSTKIIYAYYGDDNLTSQSSILLTFLAGSDFEVDDGLTFVENGTEEAFGNSTGSIRSGSGFLSFVSLNRTSNTYVYQALPVPLTDGFAIRSLATVTDDGTESAKIVQPVAISQNATAALTSSGQYFLEIAFASKVEWGWVIVEDRDTNYDYSDPISASIDTWYLAELQKHGSTARMYVYDTSYTLLDSTDMTLSSPDVERNYFHPYLKRSSSWDPVSFSGKQDWSLVRRFSSPEPTTAVGFEKTALVGAGI